MTPGGGERSAAIDALQAALVGLRMDDGGLARGNPLARLEAVAAAARAVLEATAGGDSAEDVVAHQLAVLSQRLLTTLFDVEGRQIVRSFLLARADLLALREGSRPERPYNG